MRIRVAGDRLTGRAIDLRGYTLDAGAVAAAVRGDGAADLAIDCPDPGPVHDHVGVVRSDASFSVRTALAAAARSRGHSAPADDAIAETEARLAEIDPPEIDLSEARRRVAEASDEEAALRERVATLRGRVEAFRETDDDPAAVEAELTAATRRLSEVETERIAAEQALARARKRARESRERRRERLRLADRAANLRRDARDHLAGAIREDFLAAREAVPGVPSDELATALAVVRVASIDAPVVIAGDVPPFPDPDAASRWLEAPVLRV